MTVIPELVVGDCYRPSSSWVTAYTFSLLFWVDFYFASVCARIEVKV